MIRRPPRSTLFPYRRSSDLGHRAAIPPFPAYRAKGGPDHREWSRGERGASTHPRHLDPSREVRRSEEHTSELQSLAYLVCRLLLEKKKNRKQNIHTEHRHQY